MMDFKDIDHWIFDLDNTLYPAENDLFSQVDRRMGEFIAQKFDLSFSAARKLQKTYFHQYGTTLRGLMTEHDIIPADFIDYVHDIDFGVLQVNHAMIEAINALKGEKIIYTNGAQDYAAKVLDKIGLGGVFSNIFDIVAADYQPKPNPVSYRKMVDDLGLNPEKSVMIEDIARNLIPASEMGMKTVWVPTRQKWSGEGLSQAHIDITAPNLAQWLKSLVSD